MEYKDPLSELMSSLEQIVFKDAVPPVVLAHKPSAFTEFDQLLKDSGLQADEFARAMGVSLSMVREWESRREKPSRSELKMMQVIHTRRASGKPMV